MTVADPAETCEMPSELRQSLAWWDQLIIWGGLLAVGCALGTAEAQFAYVFGLFLGVGIGLFRLQERAKGKGPLTGGDVLLLGGVYLAFLLPTLLRGERDFAMGMLVGTFHIVALGAYQRARLG